MKAQIWVLGLALALIAGSAQATREEEGRRIALEMDRVESGYGDYRASVEMTLRDRKGRESRRYMRFLTKETHGDGDKSIVVFKQPRDIKGVTALTYSHKTDPDDQWLYLPKLRRVKRISSANQSGPFVGSEFAYEDIGSQEPEKYTYRYLDQGVHEDNPCHLIERFPVNPDSGYSKQVVWVEVERMIPWRIDYYDRKGELLKTLKNSGYQLYQQRFWRPDRKEMVNYQAGKSTLIEYSDYAFSTNLSDQDLSVSALKRSR
ncbi:MAG: outer membrane lipoprotein-sorting protein [Candidatus Thiodiazotropha sp. (ex Dulcina madagascariensis)]|nr:outer membrane lipoprotein-sorting protein [Candidatus Thiodiazotropha sp. (ex Epidulcina cf. delphinae)]MCU7922340.1 outer membrane lipoprotein-sorting protein [Candidatus Thiodiazotropha sp. (ex Dulcina madagascariensis)]MCU7925046.1 outer membrane lipoprotein-sorting protein [Candidatus Thiodiazotropha sp. (ex Dulcina madagascariensis)]MCU7934926.1 outer membrane lipoprotein-sorting protein [Candidatus Thiodiazotropha sp. (ex Dulcina madagascariensis)]